MNSKQTKDGIDKESSTRNWMPTSKKKDGTDSIMFKENERLKEFFQDDIPRKKSIDVSEDTPIGLDTADTQHTLSTADTIDTEKTELKEQTLQTTNRRLTHKQRKESLEEYKATFLEVPKLEDRKPVFISREVRDRIDEIVRKLGGRRMSVSGFIENLARHHLEIYQEDIESWKKL